MHLLLFYLDSSYRKNRTAAFSTWEVEVFDKKMEITIYEKIVFPEDSYSILISVFDKHEPVYHTFYMKYENQSMGVCTEYVGLDELSIIESIDDIFCKEFEFEPLIIDI